MSSPMRWSTARRLRSPTASANTTPRGSIRGYGAFLKANSRYKHFLRAGAENEDAQLSALQTSGYATDPMYCAKAQEHHEWLAR